MNLTINLGIIIPIAVLIITTYVPVFMYGKLKGKKEVLQIIQNATK